MRIAQIAPLVERVPPKKYGGTERVVHALTEELVRRGHDVTLFATGDSITSGTLYSVYPRGIREARQKDIYGPNPWSLANFGKAYDLQERFDVIHDHMVPLSLPTAHLSRTPVVGTLHGNVTGERRKLLSLLRKPNIVTISRAQLHPGADINLIGTVYNGLPMEHYPFGEAEDYLLYVGRICMDKGTHFAIQTALELDMPLIIAAKLDTVDVPFFREYVEPYLSDRIKWVGEVNEEERNSLFAKAKCFLHPVTWREPFGLTLIEAMACGCPVVAFSRGSIPEIVAHGVTGFVVEDLDAMVEAVAMIDRIDRQACRTHALTNFNDKKMTDGYEQIYKLLTAHSSYPSFAPVRVAAR